jgi:hypothetical protein
MRLSIEKFEEFCLTGQMTEPLCYSYAFRYQRYDEHIPKYQYSAGKKIRFRHWKNQWSAPRNIEY